jgi:hypothetical protein
MNNMILVYFSFQFFLDISVKFIKMGKYGVAVF